jgi:AcrR family transcriptional regulator
MRPSSRTRLLEAAVDVAAREGMSGVTYDAIAKETGLTKAGLLYHFKSKEELLLAVRDHLAATTEAGLLEYLGEPFETATPEAKAKAYLALSDSTLARRAELVFAFEAMTNPELAASWEALMARWFPEPAVADPPSIDLLLARLAADGLWLYDATSTRPLDADVRAVLLERIAKLAGGADRPTG